MKQLIQNLKNGQLQLRDVPYPLCKSRGMVVKTVNSVISVGTEKSIIDLSKKNLIGKARARPDLFKRAIEKAKKEGFLKVFKESMNRLDEPFSLGYSASGVVVEVNGNKQRNCFNIGDKVAIAGSGFANHAEYNFVPENLCVKFPKRENGQELDFKEAAFCMLGGIALHGINEAQIQTGGHVAVIGLGLLGQLTVQILKAKGIKSFGIDIDDKKFDIAKDLGCEHTVNAKDHVEALINLVTNNQGVSSVIITAAARDNSPLVLAQKIAGQKATIVLVGVCDINLERKYFWDKELVFKVSKAAGPQDVERSNMAEFLKLIAEDKVKVKPLITHCYNFTEAVSVYDMLLKENSSYIGVLFNYTDSKEETSLIENNIRSRNVVIKKDLNSQRKSENKRKNIGFIGGGMFAKNILLPTMVRIEEVNLIGIATSRGMTCEHLASKFGFNYATTDYRRLIDDENIGSIFITTRHNLHEKFIIEALRNNKDVFVEKPLCLNEEELSEITKAYMDSDRVLMVGFNRRYSSPAKDIKEFFEDKEPFVINCRVNAGFIAPSFWVHHPEEGGGRIIGEVCHFVDFLQFITSARPVSVYTEGISGSTRYQSDDNIVSILKFEDGSIANITYTAKGTKSYSREILEIYQKESIYYLEDFKSHVKIKINKAKKAHLLTQDLGYKAELEYFFSDEIKRDNFEDYVLNSLAVFAMVKSLNSGKLISIDRKGIL